MTKYEFNERLIFSTQSNGRPFEEIISTVLPGIISVEKTNVEIDKTGIDYIATLRRGSKINIDLKLRDIGCSKFWKHGEELALELWSVVPDDIHKTGNVGWTLDESKKTHYTLHAFNKLDSDKIFILPFQLLRKSYINNFKEWNTIYKHGTQTSYKHGTQSSGTWKSECILCPQTLLLKL